MSLDFIFSTSPMRAGLGRLIIDLDSTEMGPMSNLVRMDKRIPITIQPKTENEPGADDLYAADFDDDDEFTLTLGFPDTPATSGTYIATVGTTTLALNFDADSDAMATALSAAFVVEGESACTVQALSSIAYKITGTDNGAVATGFLSVNVAGLNPNCSATIIEKSLGSVSEPYVFILIMQQQVLAQATPATIIDGLGVSGLLNLNTDNLFEYSLSQPSQFDVPICIQRRRDNSEWRTIFGPTMLSIFKNPAASIDINELQDSFDGTAHSFDSTILTFADA